jgi:hypothetical protein
LNANFHMRIRISAARMAWACFLPLARVQRPVAPTPLGESRALLQLPRLLGKIAESDPGRTLARLVGAPDSHTSDHGEGEGDRRCRLASSLTERGRGYRAEIRIRGGGRHSATIGHRAVSSNAAGLTRTEDTCACVYADKMTPPHGGGVNCRMPAITAFGLSRDNRDRGH